MTRAAVALGMVLALAAGAGFSRSLEYHHYTVTFTKDAAGIHAEKEPGVFFFEIDYDYGTDWTFVNKTGAELKVQFVEPPSRSMCHLRFSPAGSVFCESSVITIAPPMNSTATLHADALDLDPQDYCWSYDPCPGELRAAPAGSVLVPVDPDLQIERDYLLAKIIALLGSLALFAFAFIRRGRGPAPVSATPENRAASAGDPDRDRRRASSD